MNAQAYLALSLALVVNGCRSEDFPASEARAECPSDTASIQSTILGPKCGSAGCHSGQESANGLDLVSPGLESRVSNAPAAGCRDQVLVRPGDPEGSYLLAKVVNEKPACGSRMPVGEALPPDSIACLRQWVAQLPPAPPPVDAGTDASDAATCETGQTSCGAVCVNTATSTSHCGGCGRGCSTGQVCSSGACTCTGSLVVCGAACVDTNTDAKNCGGCGKACTDGTVCSVGTCTSSCPTATTACSGGCIDTLTSSFHCGGCGKSCASGMSCVGGMCVCPTGQTDCGGSCVSTISDPNHCGACGRACGAGQTCSGGACTCGAAVSYAAAIQPIWNASCNSAGCHSGMRPAADLDLTSGRSHADLVAVTSSTCSAKTLVVPGATSSSYLLNKLTGVGMCNGSQMPKAGASLPTAQLDAIRAWICNGAKND